MPLSAWFPRPTPVRVGGSLALASCLRIRDLAALESYVAAVLVSPLHGLDEEAEDYPEQLSRAYDLAESWPPAVGSPEGQSALFGSPEGIAFFLALALRETPGLDADGAAATITAAEFAEVERVAWGVEPDWKAEALRLVDRLAGVPDFEPQARSEAGEPTSWAKAVGQVVAGDDKREPLPWATPEAVGDLTLAQWRMVRSGGEPDDEGDALPDDPELRLEVCRKRWPIFHGGQPMPEAAADEDASLDEGPPPDLMPGEWEAVI